MLMETISSIFFIFFQNACIMYNIHLISIKMAFSTINAPNSFRIQAAYEMENCHTQKLNFSFILCCFICTAPHSGQMEVDFSFFLSPFYRNKRELLWFFFLFLMKFWMNCSRYEYSHMVGKRTSYSNWMNSHNHNNKIKWASGHKTVKFYNCFFSFLSFFLLSAFHRIRFTVVFLFFSLFSFGSVVFGIVLCCVYLAFDLWPKYVPCTPLKHQIDTYLKMIALQMRLYCVEFFFCLLFLRFCVLLITVYNCRSEGVIPRTVWLNQSFFPRSTFAASEHIQKTF